MSKTSGAPFLTAEWKHLAMLNYVIDDSILAPFVPSGTMLDSWNGTTFVSIVGFLFEDTRIAGVPIPFHRNFEEVNLRFYVRRNTPEGNRRGVVFIKEIVPRRMIAAAARTLYNEPYIALPMSHQIAAASGVTSSARYDWQFRGRRNALVVSNCGAPQPLQEGSEAEFITEHYWGYTAQRSGPTMEYRVEHPRWRVSEVESAILQCDAAGLYGAQFQNILNRSPSSAFLAEGSAITVYRGVPIPDDSRR
jgi:uncharacterized protein YqjF (DUF2071 family)